MARKGTHLFTSESVSMGHPDKVADQISDSILDTIIERDPVCRVACETLVTTGLCVVAGEITTDCYADIPNVVRETIRKIGYTDPTLGFDAESCGVVLSIDQQSSDISQGVSEGEGLHKEQGAGDQGMMFGFACRETEELMPMPLILSHKMMMRHAQLRESSEVDFLCPDAKCQVTVEYEDGAPRRIHTVVLSTQHYDRVSYDDLRSVVLEKIINHVMPADKMDGDTILHVNPTGRFVSGGPKADTGLTGRKLIVDTYGGMGRHGGGAFSGKDPSKVDRTASYMARHVAKNIVAAGIADRCEVQLSYAIGVAEPISVLVDTFGTGKTEEAKIEELVRAHFPLTPKRMIEYLNLRRPVFMETARHGHFGRTGEGFTWEKTDPAGKLASEAGL
jgi:S-adenosylmethionine synthetase